MKKWVILSFGLLGAVAAVFTALHLSGRGRWNPGQTEERDSGPARSSGPAAQESAPGGLAGKAAPAQAGQASAADRQKLIVLNEILAAKNDNDHRLDTDFNDLSPAARQLLQQRYQAIAPEKRNERGTVLYLLGRNMKTAQDVAFMGAVLAEPPCLSLADCGRESKTASSEHEDDELGVTTTLAYPSLVVLREFGQALENCPSLSGPMKAEMRHKLELGAGSPVPSVAQKSRSLLSQIKSCRT